MIQCICPSILCDSLEPDFMSTQHTPLFDHLTVRQIEAEALTNQANQTNQAKQSPTLMQQAGYAAARLALACYPHAQNIYVLAGKGHNGGDAIVAATWLKKWGKNIHLIWLGTSEQMSVDTAQAVHAAREIGLILHPYTYNTVEHFKAKDIDLIIDGLLGIGLDAQRKLTPELSELILLTNLHSAPVISVDIPSGLLSDTGATCDHAIQAEHTLTFLCAKLGLFTAQGRAYCGQIWLEPLGCTPHQTPIAKLYHPQHSLALPRAHNTHKGNYGDVSIIGGAQGMTGAAILAARSAIKAGAGRVYVSLLDEQSTANMFGSNFPELMFKPPQANLFKQQTVVCGCGAGKAIEPWLPQLLGQCPRLVLDADALNCIASSAPLQKQLQSRWKKGLASIITPHPLEAARLLGQTTLEIQNNRLESALALAHQYNCTCILKGSGSIIATPEQTPYINSSGNATLATAGTGDVLAGWIGGKWGNVQLNLTQLHQLAAQCVWEHGYAANLWVQQHPKHPDRALIASELLQWI